MLNFYIIRSFNEIIEFHNLMPIVNIPSVLENGILSYSEVTKLEHKSIAMDGVQTRRNKRVPGGLQLHQYANLYFHARNPMLYVRRVENICILRIAKSISDVPGVVFTDRNAASNYVRFLGIRQVDTLNYRTIYARDWNDGNEYLKWEKKGSSSKIMG